MPEIETADGVNMHYEESGAATPAVFEHEFAGVPGSGHTITSEERDAVNAALAGLFAAAECGRRLAHRPSVR
jgi:hypothetical protein